MKANTATEKEKEEQKAERKKQRWSKGNAYRTSISNARLE